MDIETLACCKPSSCHSRAYRARLRPAIAEPTMARFRPAIAARFNRRETSGHDADSRVAPCALDEKLQRRRRVALPMEPSITDFEIVIHASDGVIGSEVRQRKTFEFDVTQADFWRQQMGLPPLRRLQNTTTTNTWLLFSHGCQLQCIPPKVVFFLRS